MKKKILISTGGTGGHVIPALSLHDHLSNQFETYLVTDKRGTNFINKEKYNFKILYAPKLNLNIIKFPIMIFLIFLSFIQSIIILKKNKVEIVISLGGYMSFSMNIAAKVMNKKIYLFEPNLIIGRANKFFLKFCNKIFCSTKEIINFPEKYKSKIVTIDHFLKKEIYNFTNTNTDTLKKKITLLIVGGSQGAKIFDEEIKQTILDLSKKFQLFVYQQVTFKEIKNLEKFYNIHNIEYKIFDFDKKIFEYMSKANLAITRSGASMLAELAFLQVPGIVIPYPHAKDDHQLKNAIFYENMNYGWLFEQKYLIQKKLTFFLKNVIENETDYMNKKKRLNEFSNHNSWNKVNTKLIDIINES